MARPSFQMSMTRLAVPLLLALVCLASPGPAPAAERSPYLELVGAMHEHSAYSDGWPGTTPDDFYASGRKYGLDFMAGSDHSTNMGLPSTFNEGCYGEGRGGDGEILLAECAVADGPNGLRKWEATAEAATKHTDGSFAGIRGFEWSSDRFGHLNVLFSKNWVNEVDAGGYADMGAFWRWFTTSPAQGGGADGLGTFNHPSAKKLDFQPPGGPDLDWKGFAYVPAADERMVGMELFNDVREYGSDTRNYKAGPFVEALDKGWHVGAIGAEDLGHRKPPLDNWGGPEWPKTVVLAHDRTPEGIRAALLDRRFYALAAGEGSRLRMTFGVDGADMGSRLVRATGDKLKIAATTTDPSLALELVTSAGKVVATGTGTLAETRTARRDERYFFVRARRAGKPVAYSSPIWIEATREAPKGQWLAGDGHVHTCYSHDSYCPPNDDNTGPETLYSSFASVPQRFAEGAAKGLDFLTISDHNDVRAWSDPAFGSAGVIGVHAYEHSLPGGHAHVIGAKEVKKKVPDAATLAASVNGDGSLFQINHPTEKGDAEITGCEQIARGGEGNTDWKYGFTARPDTLEVWNATTLLRPAEVFWECWLQQGWRVPVTSGSDSHGGNQANLGMPSLWVLAEDRSEAAILRALRNGRTTITRLAPSQGAARLLLESDADGDGAFESTMGDTVAPGAAMRVRGDGLSAPATARIRANGKTLLEKELAPGGTVSFKAPSEPGWVRASLLGDQRSADADPNCTPGTPSPLDLCTADLTYLAMTSPIYVEKPGAAKPGDAPSNGGGDGGAPSDPGSPSPAQFRPDDDEPDDGPSLAPAFQSDFGKPLPTIGPFPRIPDPPARAAATKRPRLLLTVKRSVVRLGPAGSRFDVQVRRGRSNRWRPLKVATTATRVRLTRGTRGVRARLRLPDGRAAGWVTRRVRGARTAK